MNDLPILIISGPTGAGKSDLSVSLASELSGEIVSLDSVQVYRGFDIGTAKASIETRKKTPHHLIDICDPQENYNAARFLKDAEAVIRDIRSRNRLPIFVGGTTMYLTSLLHGLSFLKAYYFSVMLLHAYVNYLTTRRRRR